MWCAGAPERPEQATARHNRMYGTFNGLSAAGGLAPRPGPAATNEAKTLNWTLQSVG